MKGNYTLKVIAIIKETPDCVTLCFKQPAFKKINYLSGQYLTLIFNINGLKYLRPYSFSSAAGVDETINITVKRVIGGVVSNHVVDKVCVGEIFEVLKPSGNFVLPSAELLTGKNIFLWGAGSGITPLISLLKYLLNNNLCEHITLIYANKNFENAIFSAFIDQLSQRFKPRFTAWHFHTKSSANENNPYLIKERINVDNIERVINAEKMPLDSYHYLCGPPGFKESIYPVLDKYRVDRNNIFIEEFLLIKDQSEFENVVTSTVTIQISNELKVFEVPKGRSILEAGLDALLDIPYSCQAGSCLLCKGKVIEGTIKTIGLSNLPESLSEDDSLLCCSFPLTDNLKIII